MRLLKPAFFFFGAGRLASSRRCIVDALALCHLDASTHAAASSSSSFAPSDGSEQVGMSAAAACVFSPVRLILTLILFLSQVILIFFVGFNTQLCVCFHLILVLILALRRVVSC
jgi:hypothetical protein